MPLPPGSSTQYASDTPPVNSYQIGRSGNTTTERQAISNFWAFPITQGFGPTDEPLDSAYGGYPHFNKGFDFATPLGTQVRPVVPGTVISVGDKGDGWGLRVWVQDANGDIHSYGHLSSIGVKEGQRVSSSTVLGQSGSSGKSTGPHLSYDVFGSDGQFKDPSEYLSTVAPQAVAEYNISKGGSPTPGVRKAQGPTNGLPSINDYYITDPETGETYFDASYWDDLKKAREIQEMEKGDGINQLATYADAIIKQLSLEIDAGQLEVQKASEILRARVEGFKTAQDAYNGAAFKYGAPVGAKYIPGSEPGGYATTTLGLPSREANAIVNDPYKEALALYGDAQSRMGAVKTPSIPDISSMLRPGSQAVAGVGAGSTPPAPPSTPPPAPGSTTVAGGVNPETDPKLREEWEYNELASRFA